MVPGVRTRPFSSFVGWWDPARSGRIQSWSAAGTRVKSQNRGVGKRVRSNGTNLKFGDSLYGFYVVFYMFLYFRWFTLGFAHYSQGFATSVPTVPIEWDEVGFIIFICIFYEKVGFFILFGAFHFMWCRLPASYVSSHFASFLVCTWTRVLGRRRRRLKRLSLLGWSTSPLPRARADLLVVQETPKTHPKRLSLLGLSTSPSWPATIQLCGFSIPRSRAQPTGQWGRKSVDCMLGTVEGFAFGKVGFAFYLTDRVRPSNIIRKPTSNCSTEPDICVATGRGRWDEGHQVNFVSGAPGTRLQAVFLSNRARIRISLQGSWPVTSIFQMVLFRVGQLYRLKLVINVFCVFLCPVSCLCLSWVRANNLVSVKSETWLWGTMMRAVGMNKCMELCRELGAACLHCRAQWIRKCSQAARAHITISYYGIKKTIAVAHTHTHNTHNTW